MITVAGCAQPLEHHVLRPYPDPVGPGHPWFRPQPRRAHPSEVAVAGGLAWVGLAGSVDEPDDRVVGVDLTSGELVATAHTAPGVAGLAVHPDGARLLALGRFGDWAVLLDATTGETLEEVRTGFYTTEAVFTPDGRSLWMTDRWRDAVQVWTLDPGAPGLAVQARHELPVGVNPRDVAVSADGRRVAVAALASLEVSLFDTTSRSEVARIDVGAPPNGLAFAGDWLVVATTAAATLHPALEGPDGDGDGLPGDGTPNVDFQDQQNELAVFRASDGAAAWRYTSDTTCCREVRDVDPTDLARRGDLLPDRSTWIVAGALPEQVAADGDQIWVTYSASDQIQRFTIDARTGALEPGPVARTGHAPHGLAVTADAVLVAERLGETLGVYDRGLDLLDRAVVGDLSGGAFPATDEELGELVLTVTAPFTVDGDQACEGCHRESGAVAKAISMPMFAHPGRGRRAVLPARGLADTTPWFFEALMDPGRLQPTLGAWASPENFCCSDPTLWPEGPPPSCAAEPPPACDGPAPGSPDGFAVERGVSPEHPWPTAYATRDDFLLAAASEHLGRETTFGDVLGPRRLDFDGLARAVGLYLVADPRLLPNPNDPSTAAARRGRALFERADVGCAGCHPSPTFSLGDDAGPALLGPVVSPDRAPDGTNLDLLSDEVVRGTPAQVDACADVCDPAACAADAQSCDDLRDLRLGVPSLRGLWDRGPALLHDGRARSLREVLCTPGHPALKPGESGFNERDGLPDTHGATSHLGADEIGDLAAYLETL